MNQNPTPYRDCWNVLARKASEQARHWQSEIALSQEKLAQLQASEVRLTRIYEEYQQRQSAQQDARRGLQDHMHERQFMAQLMQLQARVRQDMSQTRMQLAQQRSQLLKAQAEEQKMQTLAEQDRGRMLAHQHRQEQRRMDELAIARYNLRPGH